MARQRKKTNGLQNDPRLKITAIVCTIVVSIIGIRLVLLMIVQHSFYSALAAGSHEIYTQLIPERGEIFIQDSRSGEEFPVAINRDYFLIYADTRKIEDEDVAEDIAEELAYILDYDDERKLEVYYILLKKDDPYEPIEKKVDQEIVDQIKEKDLPGIGFVRKPHRFYPEEHLAVQVVGFLGKAENGQDIGRYGVEGYWQEELSGSGGFFEGAKSAGGRWIPLAGRLLKPAEDGLDLLLTIDRTLQYQACEKLREAMVGYEAQSASLVITDPFTGAVRVMCSLPDFNPNIYNEVEAVTVYNNSTIFTPYEPGSIFKPITMSAAINEELVSPNTPFYDTGVVEDICDTPIRNAGGKIYEQQNLTGVLENSINTGMVFTVEQLGKQRFKEYVEKFGFGLKGGIELDTESSGTIESLSRNKKLKRIDCYTATGSFGQGLTVTPLQMNMAYGAIANGGTLMKPYIVEEKRFKNGKIEKTKPIEVRKVLTKRAASLTSGMLVSVIDSGQASSASVDGYFIAGKTGTAQIPGPGGYSEETIHSFVGFGPVDNPKFVMLVKFEKPQREYSSITAAPTFGEIAKLVVDYYQLTPER